MLSGPRRGVAFALLSLVALSACRKSPPGAVSTAPAPAAPGGSPTVDGVAQARADSVRHPYTAADIRFMTDMIGHHSQAILMAEMAPTHTQSSSIQTLAARIISSQQDEIATMQQWLRDRQQPVPDAGPMAAMDHGTGHDAHAMHGGSGMAGMPGMLTAAQLQELDAARGRAFDRLFLTYMIQHHRGAITMVEQLFGSFGAGQDETVFRFATDVNVDQITEIARMEQMLVTLILETPPQ